MPKVKVLLRIEEADHDLVRLCAAARRMTVTAWINEAIQAGILRAALARGGEPIKAAIEARERATPPAPSAKSRSL